MTDTATMEGLKQDVMEATNHLRSEADKFGTKSAQFEQALKKTDAAIKKFDDENQALVMKMAEEKKAELEAKEALEAKVTDLERSILDMSRDGSGDKKGAWKNSPEYKSFSDWARDGHMKTMVTIGREEKGHDDAGRELKTLRLDDPTMGGYLSMPEMDNMIIRSITEISPVRSVARVKTVGRKTLEIPVRTSIPIATYEGELQATDETNSTYGSESLTCYRQTAQVFFSYDQMMDSAFDIESEIRQDVSEAYAFGEGRAFVLGDGAKQPEGFLQDSRLTVAFNATTAPEGYRETSSSQTLDMDDLKLLTGDLKVGYMPMYAFNRRTKAFISTLKGSDGQYLWQMPTEGAPATINGDRYILFEDMPDIAANAFAVVYADFMRGYTVTDRSGMEVIRDIYTGAGQNLIKLIFHKYNTGQVVLPEAFKLLRIQA